MADQASQMRSLRDVASQINSGGDLDTVLRDLIRAACEHGGWALGSIMAIDAPHGEAHVVVRHDPTLLRRRLENRWELATSPALIALQRNEPVYIRDARASDEFPGYRREAFERDYRTVLVLPRHPSRRGRRRSAPLDGPVRRSSSSAEIGRASCRERVL